MWPDTPIARLFRVAVPIVQAPMAGEANTSALVAAVSEAGGLGTLGLAYSQPDAIRKAISEVRALTAKPFGINLFAKLTDPEDPARIAHARAVLAPWRERYGLPDNLPASFAMPDFDAQMDVVLAEKPAVFSITFGRIPPSYIERLKTAGIVVVGTATTIPEAELLAADGVDAVVAQGSEAGAHRGTFLDSVENSMIGTMALVPAMADRLHVPVIAAGGIMDGRGIAAALMLGAAGVQMGTAFLVSAESGAGAAWRKAIQDERNDKTELTRAFSGRAARGIRNRFMAEIGAHQDALPGFPTLNSMTRTVRGAATMKGDAQALSLWAGQAAPLARPMAAGALMRVLVQETEQRLAQGFSG